MAWAKKIGVPSTSIDVPAHNKDELAVRSHFAAVACRMHDAPDAIQVIVAIAEGGRPHARVGGLLLSDIEGEDGL